MPAPTTIEHEEEVRPLSFADIGGKFAAGLPSLREDTATPPPAPAKAETPPPAAKPVPEAAVAPAAPAPPPEVPPVTPAPTQPTAPAKPAEETPPKNAGQWETFKKARKEAEDKLREEIKAREARATELEKQLKEAQERPAPEPTEPRPEDKDRIAQLEGLLKESLEKINVLDVRENPLFKKHFDGKVSAAVAAAKAAAGDQAALIDEVLKLSGAARDEKLEEVLDAIPSSLAKGKVLRAIGDLDTVEAERQAELARAELHKEGAVATATARQQAAVKAAEAEFSKIIRGFQDPKDGFPILRRVEGNDAHNQRAAQIEADAKALITGKGVKPDQIMRGAVFAAVMPHALQEYAAEQQAHAAEVASLQAQIAELKGAQPGGGGASAPSTAPAPAGPITKVGIKPGPWRDSLGNDMVNRIRQSGATRQ